MHITILPCNSFSTCRFEENIDNGDELFVDKVDASLDDAKASIYLNTIGDLLYFM